MTEVYTIQKGDTLTKIAREHYGLSGGEAYLKALEIAKQNGIENPNLIYAGASLNLFDLGDETQETENEGDTFVPQNQAPAEEIADAEVPQAKDIEEPNTYEALMEAQKQYAQQLEGLNETEEEAPKTFQFVELSNENLEEDYINAVLDLAEQQIEADDKEDENGVKDGAIDYKEFEAQQVAFYKATYGDLGVSDEELAQLMGLQDIFNQQDIDGSGALEKNEIAFSFMMSDINFDPELFGQNPAINLEDHAEFDGIIDFDQQAITAKMLNDDMLAGGNTYANIYNKVSELITTGIENREAAKEQPQKNDSYYAGISTRHNRQDYADAFKTRYSREKSTIGDIDTQKSILYDKRNVEGAPIAA